MKLNRNDNKPKNTLENDVENSPAKKAESVIRPEISAYVKNQLDKQLKRKVLGTSTEELSEQAKKQVIEDLFRLHTLSSKDQAIVRRHVEALARHSLEIANKQNFNRNLHSQGRTQKKQDQLLKVKPELAKKFETIIKRTREQFFKLSNEEFERSKEYRYQPNEQKIVSIIPEVHADMPFSNKIEPRSNFRTNPEGWHPQKKLLWSTVVAKDSNIASFSSKMMSQTHKTRSNLQKTFGHIVISMKPGDTISDDQATWMAQRHLTRMGVDIDQHAILMFRHDNTDKQHFHVIYNRVRHDGKVHHIFGATQVCQLERDIQDRIFGIESQINPGTALTKGMQSALGRLASGNLKAELRSFQKPSVLVDTVGEFAQMRLEQLGRMELESGGGFVKHQYFTTERAAWLIGHCAVEES